MSVNKLNQRSSRISPLFNKKNAIFASRNSAKMKIKPSLKKKVKGGRKISQVKRSNIKRNKLVKQGKAKPNSQPKYIPNQGKNKKQAGGCRNLYHNT